MKGRWIKSDPLMGSTGREDFRGTGKVTTPPAPHLRAELSLTPPPSAPRPPLTAPFVPFLSPVPAVRPLRAAHAQRDLQDRRQPPRGGGAGGAAVALQEPPVPQQTPLPKNRRARGGRGRRAALQRPLPGHRWGGDAFGGDIPCLGGHSPRGGAAQGLRSQPGICSSGRSELPRFGNS